MSNHSSIVRRSDNSIRSLALFSFLACLTTAAIAWASPPPAGIRLAPIEPDGNVNTNPNPSDDADGVKSVAAVGTLEQMQAFDRTHPDQGDAIRPYVSRSGRQDGAPADIYGSVPSGSDVDPLPDVLAPALGANFIGMIDNNTMIPPDTTGAVGPNHVFEFLNTGRTIYFKNGATAFGLLGYQAFWSSLGTGAGQPAQSLSDPRVLYDQYSGRWLVSSLGLGTNKWVLVGVSQTTDPGGAYNLYAIRVNVSTNGFNHAAHFMDFDNMGFDPNNVIITGNIFTSAGAFIHSDVYIINKARLLAGPAGQTLVYNTDFKIVHSPCPAFGANINFAPCITYGQTPSTAVNYVIDNGWYDTFDLTVRYFRVAVVTGTGASATYDCLGDAGFVMTPGCYNFNVANAIQPSGCTAINAGDYRISSPPVLRNGKIWFTHHAGATTSPCADPASNPAATKAEVYWYEQDPSKIVAPGLTDQFGTVKDSVEAYYYPSIAINRTNCVMLGFTGSGSGSGQFASGFYTSRKASDPVNTMQSVSVLKTGEDLYFKTFGGGRNRWGDYSATCVDPADDLTLWTLQEYARPASPVGSCTDGAGRWGTWWGSMRCRTLGGPSVELSAGVEDQ